jgi:drug/metabolite transporter (DMT)-like permease
MTSTSESSVSSFSGKVQTWFQKLTKRSDTPNSNQYELVQVEEMEANKKQFKSTTIDEDASTSEKSENASLPSSTTSTNATKSWKTILLAWISLILAILSGASIGPAFKYMTQHGIRSCLSASWRCQCMIIFLIPLAILESWSDRNKRVDWFGYKPDLPYPVIIHTIFSGLAWAGNLLCWIVGLQFTTTFKASLIACTHPLMLVLYLKCRGIYVSYMSMFGVIFAFSGLIISNYPDLYQEMHQSTSSSDTTTSTTNNTAGFGGQILGISLCFLAAACEVVILFNRIATTKYVPLMQVK